MLLQSDTVLKTESNR